MNDNDDRKANADEAQARFDSADNIVSARGGHDPEADVPYTIAAQVQATIGVGHALLAITELLSDISGHLDALAANTYREGEGPAW